MLSVSGLRRRLPIISTVLALNKIAPSDNSPKALYLILAVDGAPISKYWNWNVPDGSLNGSSRDVVPSKESVSGCAPAVIAASKAEKSKSIVTDWPAPMTNACAGEKAASQHVTSIAPIPLRPKFCIQRSLVYAVRLGTR